MMHVDKARKVCVLNQSDREHVPSFKYTWVVICTENGKLADMQLRVNTALCRFQ